MIELSDNASEIIVVLSRLKIIILKQYGKFSAVLGELSLYSLCLEERCMKLNPPVWAQSILVAAIVSISSSVFASADKSEDPYVQGFKTYAKEINSYSNILTNAANFYADEVISAERKVGYIGEELPLPKAKKIGKDIYAVIGSMIWHTPSNFGVNNNLGFAIFEGGVFVFNAGANPAVAYSLHQQIKRITDKKVKWVAVENNQGHAYLGASYWSDIGVKNLYSSGMANQQFHDAFDSIKAEWASRVGRNITKTARDVSDKFTTYESELTIDVGGGELVKLIDFGPGHTPASTSLYIPSRNLLMSGDLGFNERMPVFFKYTDSFAWTASFANMMEQVPAGTTILPGHGNAADLSVIKKQTYDYLRYMQDSISKIADVDGTLEQALAVDQSMYKDRPVFDQAANNNAQHIYNEITGGEF